MSKKLIIKPIAYGYIKPWDKVNKTSRGFAGAKAILCGRHNGVYTKKTKVLVLPK